MRTSVIGSSRPSRVVRGTAKKAKNHHLVILGILEIQLLRSFWASITSVLESVFSLRNPPPSLSYTSLGNCFGERVGVLYLEIGACLWRMRINPECNSAKRDAEPMERPTLHQLKLLLKEDEIFRDYFNTFLNLPVRISAAQNPKNLFFPDFPRFCADIFQESEVRCRNSLVRDCSEAPAAPRRENKI